MGDYMKNIIFFDFDGTLIDCSEFQTNKLKSVMLNHGVNISKINFLELIGPPLSLTFEKYIKDVPSKQVLEEYNNTFKPEMLKGIFLYDGIKQMLEFVRKLGYKICVVSLQLANIVEAQLNYLGIRNLIDDYFCDNVEKGFKSKIDLVKQVLMGEGFNKEEIVFVGDTINDILAGKNNGITSIAVSWGFGKVTEKEADFVVNDVKELENTLKRLK